MNVRSYDVVLNFKLIESFSTLKKAETFIKKSGIDYDLMVVDTPIKEAKQCIN